MPQFDELDPRALLPHPLNRGVEVDDVQDLVENIRTVGVLQPLLVYPLGDTDHEDSADRDGADHASTGHDDDVRETHQLVIGHRRRVASIVAGLEKVPCMVAEDEGAAMMLAKMLSENLHRKDLSAAEEAAGYHQLTLLDWTPDQIAQMTSQPLPRVTSALAVHRLPTQAREAATKATDAGQLDLEQAADLEEFADDPKAMQRILQRATGPWGFRHAIEDEKAKRDRREKIERLRAELVVAGVRVVSRPRDWGYGGREEDVTYLADSDGNRLDPQQVRARPGFAAFIETQYTHQDPYAVIFCLDPEAWGYTRTRRTRFVPEAERAAQAEADRAEEQRLADLERATRVRRDFLKKQYGTAKAAKRLYADVLRATVIDPATALHFPHTVEELATSLAGTAMDADTLAGATIDRLIRFLVARWLTAHEYNLDRLTSAARWGGNPAPAVAYLDRLVADGYTLSDAEQQLRDDLVAEIAELGEDDLDDDPDDDLDEQDEADEQGDADDIEEQDDSGGDGRSDGEQHDRGDLNAHDRDDEKPGLATGDDITDGPGPVGPDLIGSGGDAPPAGSDHPDLRNEQSPHADEVQQDPMTSDAFVDA